jgi:hypothetical protein
VGLEVLQREAFPVYIYLNIFLLLYGQQLHSVHLKVMLNNPGQENPMFAGGLLQWQLTV